MLSVYADVGTVSERVGLGCWDPESCPEKQQSCLMAKKFLDFLLERHGF